MSEVKETILMSARQKAFPTEAEIAEWNRLSDAEKLAIVEANEEAAFQSGTDPKMTAAEHIAKARAVR